MSEWISVEDRLPENELWNNSVVVHRDDGLIFTARGFMVHRDKEMPDPSVGVRSRYTHWMTLPAPPYE